ncbi:MAG: aryl-sulfate sulfotransferase [Alphaproteobacteria bacterium]|nr:aryl-sulfate sulfotransferase [Alphaproteobacteria bacterium]
MFLVLTACRAGLGDVAFVEGGIAGTGAVTFEGRSGMAHVEWTDDDGTVMTTPEVDAEGGSVPVIGLPAATDLELSVVVVDGGKTLTSDPVEVRVIPARSVPAMQVLTDDAARCTTGGYVLTSWIGEDGSGVGIVDRRGRWVWSFDIDAAEEGVRIGRARAGRDGASILYNLADAKLQEDYGETVRVAMDGSSETRTRTVNAHHDFVELPDGTQAWLSYAIREMTDAEFGSNPGACSLDGRGFDSDNDGVSDGCIVAVTTVMEGTEGEGTDHGDVVFDLFTDIPQAVTTHGAPDNFLSWAYDWDHGNSLTYVPSEDAYYVMSRWLDVMWKVDRASKSLAWQLGGEYSDFTASAADKFVHAHMSDAWEGGMLVYDNHNADEDGEQDGPTRIVEYAIDEGAMTYEAVWSWQPDNSFDDILGDARRIPVDGCDHTLVTRAADAKLVEVDSSGTVFWEIGSTQPGAILTRSQFLPDLYDFGSVAY